MEPYVFGESTRVSDKEHKYYKTVSLDGERIGTLYTNIPRFYITDMDGKCVAATTLDDLEDNDLDCEQWAESVLDDLLNVNSDRVDELAELRKLADCADKFFNDVMPQIGGLTIQDFANLNELGMALTAHKQRMKK